MRECLVGNARNELVRGEEGAGIPPFVRRHHRLEGAAEHLRIDGSLGPLGTLFTRREPVSAKQLREEQPELLVAKLESGVRSLERGPREQTAVEKRNAAKRAGGRRPGSHGRVERAKEQGQ